MKRTIQPGQGFEPPPAIAPVPESSHRPTWSVMIPTFNCAKYLGQALESVLMQDPGAGQMQIEVIDDCSTTDDPETVVRDVGKGRVMFHRKPKNEGPVANFNTCIRRSHGHLLHILHGDDFLADGFYTEILNLRARSPEANLLACRNFGVDEDAKICWASPMIAELEFGGCRADAFYYRTPLQFCGVAIRRNFFTEHGGFLPSLIHTADCEMWTRAISRGGGIVSSRALSYYRVFSSNGTSKLKRSGENILDLVRLNSVLARRFPDFSSFNGQLRAGSMARSQARHFAKLGDREASEANWCLWRELMPLHIRFERRIRKIFHRL